MPNRSTPQIFKTQALKHILNAMPTAIIVSLIWFVITTAITLLHSELMGIRALSNELFELTRNVSTADPDAVYSVIANYPSRLSPIAPILTLALSACSAVVETGFVWYTLRIVRGEKPDVRSLFEGFERFGKVLWLCILKGVLVSIGTLFFIVPGIVLSLRYSMALRICYDNPEYGAVKCLRESARLMKGAKSVFLLLVLSFAGWYVVGWLISAFFYVAITDIWMNLSAAVSFSVFYDIIIARQNPKSPPVAEG